MDETLPTLTVTALLEGYRERAFSPLEVVQSLLARIDALNPHLNAFITVAAEQALDEARRCTDELTAGRERGPLHGVPFAAKDLFDTAGLRTTYGSAIFTAHAPTRDAAAVRRLTEAGAILLGKTATHEFAWGITTVSAFYGATHNPWRPERVAGGSSGGSAAAVAAGLVPAALGTDTGGSIRIPSAFCGVVGLKPTFGRISQAGIFPLARSLDHPGPLARSVEDVALLLSVLAGDEADDPSTAPIPVADYHAALRGGLAGLRVGVCPDLHLVALSPAVNHAYHDTVRTLTALGATIVEVAFPDAATISDTYTSIQHAEAYDLHHREKGLYPAEVSRYGGDVAAHLAAAATVTLPRYLAAERQRVRLTTALVRLLTERIDLLLTPVAASAPPLIGSNEVEHLGQTIPFRHAVLPYTVPHNLAGLPSCAIRAGFDDLGIPIGMQLTAAPWREETVLRASAAITAATPVIQSRWPAPPAAR